MTRDTRRLSVLLAVAAGIVLAPVHAHAYIGPGAGLSAIGSLLALIAAIMVGLVGFVWYPVKRALRLLRSKRRTEGRGGATADGRMF